jgi:hypothetical protein
MSHEIERIADYDNVTLDLLLEQYKPSSLRLILRAFNGPIEKVEQAAFEIRNEFWLDPVAGAESEEASGEQLDILGAIFDEPRSGRTDTEYRDAIREKAAQRLSGTPEEIISILTGLFGGTFVEYYPGSPSAPATYYLLTDADIARPSLDFFSPAGVLGLLLSCLVDGEDNDIVDAQGNSICAVISIIALSILDAEGNEIVDAQGNFIEGVGVED